jgi:orotate phosphoribosyltransferase
VNSVNVESLLKATGAVLEGHFRLTSGRHSAVYIEKFRIMEDPAATMTLCAMIADYFRPFDFTTVIGPAMGGVILAYEVAGQLGLRAIFAEKDAAGQLMFDRGFLLGQNEPVLIVDDVLTTGGSVNQVLDLARRAGARPVGVGMLIDRTDGAVNFGIPFFACHSMAIESFAADNCPLCKQGLPLIET